MFWFTSFLSLVGSFIIVCGGGKPSSDLALDCALLERVDNLDEKGLLLSNCCLEN